MHCRLQGMRATTAQEPPTDTAIDKPCRENSCQAMAPVHTQSAGSDGPWSPSICLCKWP